MKLISRILVHLSLPFIFIFFYSGYISAQSQIDLELKEELKTMSQIDQEYRKIYFIESVFTKKSDSLKTRYNILEDNKLKEFLAEKIKQADSLNLIQIDCIIEKYNRYPGKDLVGESQSSDAWLIMQHAPDPKKYLSLIKEAADSNQLSFRYYAMTLDRVLMYENKPQIYGTQAKMVKIKSSDKAELIIFPIQNSKEVNKLRKSAGFDTTIKKYAKQLNIKYKPYKMEDIHTD